MSETDMGVIAAQHDEIMRLRERVVKLERSQLETSIENNRLREALTELRTVALDALSTGRWRELFILMNKEAGQ